MPTRNKGHRKRTPVVIAKRRQVAATPGTILPPADAARPVVRLLAYDGAQLTERTLERIADAAAFRGKDQVLWVDIVGVGDGATFEELGRVFGLHALALEDVVNLHQRPKAEDYGDHAYVVLKMPSENDRMSLEQVSVFVGGDFVITVQERPGDCLDPVRRRLRDGRGRIRTAGADYLGYAMTDAIIDSYFPLVERLSGRLEQLEEQVVRAPDADAINEIHVIRHDLQALRQVLASSREAIGELTRGEAGPFSEPTRVFLRDCQDHTAQLLDAVEACRELALGLMDLHLAGVNFRMNETMKVLTLISTIFIPLGFIAGVYGMNFDRDAAPWNMPELGWRYGYPFALLLMAATATAFVVFFRWRGWWGPSRSSRPGDDTPAERSTRDA